eukprot:CAMPEP_0168347164 /NCGR_PEP_ID=MMETSP0213-20121227/18815_1 /TAXON_ID=151035 /ORGANISM="Euplotes harpa, Strain FSP1.4" /LENGTH=50 /DNA_ID=CAMNT_0008356177 /DNA_START=21 /DNA_END=170 /DNA_ORIENTATION=-
MPGMYPGGQNMMGQDDMGKNLPQKKSAGSEKYKGMNQNDQSKGDDLRDQS